MTTPELTAWIKKNPIIVGCGALSLALIVGLYLRSDLIPTANTTLEEKSTQARRYAQNISHASQLQEQYDSLTASNKAIEARLIRPTDIGINQQYFYKLESDSGVKLTDLRQGGRTTTKGAYAPIAFNVTLQGDFKQVMTFLQALENGVHYCRVLTASCTGGRTGLVTLSLNLELLGHP